MRYDAPSVGAGGVLAPSVVPEILRRSSPAGCAASVSACAFLPDAAFPCGARSGRSLLAKRRCVLDAALGPELVQAARDLERAFLADIALEHLAIVADAGDNLGNPVIVEAEHLADLRLRLLTENALDFWVVRTLHLLDIGLGDAQFLS